MADRCETLQVYLDDSDVELKGKKEKKGDIVKTTVGLSVQNFQADGSQPSPQTVHDEHAVKLIDNLSRGRVPTFY